MVIILIGMMGSGKSTVGRLLAKKLGWPLHDTDETVEKEQGKSVADLFKDHGEPFFRALEAKAVSALMEKDQLVVSTGGGVPCRDENWAAFKKNGFVVWLKAGPEKILERVKKAPKGARPLLAEPDLEKIKALLQQREPFYQKADLALDTDRMNSSEAAEAILKELKQRNLF